MCNIYINMCVRECVCVCVYKRVCMCACIVLSCRSHLRHTCKNVDKSGAADIVSQDRIALVRRYQELIVRRCCHANRTLQLFPTCIMQIILNIYYIKLHRITYILHGSDIRATHTHTHAHAHAHIHTNCNTWKRKVIIAEESTTV